MTSLALIFWFAEKYNLNFAGKAIGLDHGRSLQGSARGKQSIPLFSLIKLCCGTFIRPILDGVK